MNIIEHSGLDPKTSILVKVFKDSRPPVSKMEGVSASSGTSSGSFGSLLTSSLDSEALFEGLEVWSLSDVVFLDDSPAVLGRVVTVDQLQAIVDISHASSESGTMGSTSTAQSTLKVFKLSEIEPCMDSRLSSSPSKPPAMNASSSQKGAAGGNGRNTPTMEIGEGGGEGEKDDGKVVISQHIAGLVQHVPICLLSPSSSKNHTSVTLPDPDSGHTHSGCVHGHYPLAMRMTDNGPMILVKRLSDGRAFLACSGHSGFPSFSSSSFVSLSSREAKLGRCTIEEESVSALDGGYERVKNSNVFGSEKRVKSAWPCPAILNLHKSQALMLQDANGHISSLSGGLRLKPPFAAASSSVQRHNKGQPLMPYKFVVTRTHLVKKDTNVLVIVAGELGTLLPHILLTQVLNPV